MRTLIVIDGNSLMYRAFYALPLLTHGDTYTNAVYGFLNMLWRMAKDYRPTHLAVALDMHGPTFRHAKFADYKGGRKATPEELRPQFDLLRQLLTDMGITFCQLSPYEADDILGTLSREAEEAGDQTYLVTGDKDALQLVDTHTTVLFTRKGLSQVDVMTPESMPELYGVGADLVTDLKGLMGDSSDNLPGVPGIGEKTALKLLAEYGSLRGIYDNLDSIKGKLKEKLETGKESAFLCQEIATIDRHVPLDTHVEDCVLPPLDTAKNLQVLRTYGFETLSKRVEKALQENGTEPVPEALATENAEHVFTEPFSVSDPSSSLPFSAVPVWKEESVITDPGTLSALLGDKAGMKAALSGSHDAFSLAFEDGTVLSLPLKIDLLSEGFDPADLFSLLRPVLQGSAPLLLLDVKAWRHSAGNAGLSIKAPCQDVSLMAYLNNSLRTDYSLSSLKEEMQITIGNDAAALWELGIRHAVQMRENGVLSLYQTIELPLEKVLFSMEQEGFHLDSATLSALGKDMAGQISRLAEEIYALAGEEFNILSPKQLGMILFEKLGLPAGRKTRTGYSTDADTLEALSESHPIADKILEYRTLTKLKSTYIDALPPMMDKEGFIHTTFKQTVTSTGRISSADPNLQNIPVRSSLGREIRKAFIPRDREHILLDADYSQIELRVLAHMSGDPAMCDAFLSGQDIHTRTASEVFGVPMQDVTPELRARAKAVNFGIVYGISDFGLSRNSGISRREAHDFIRRYFERYPDVRRYMDTCIATGQTQGYVQTLFGRRRPLPEMESSNRVRRAFGERVAMNTPIQGTAADIIKIAMVRVYDALQKGGYQARLILQVHDELLIDCPLSEADAVSELLRTTMENAIALKVPLEASVQRGDTWYAAK
ncbi:MAG: DNA polymerase I [Clostridia bacterium]|nr:DNA polymerase I [Clostridia bacterium]